TNFMKTEFGKQAFQLFFLICSVCVCHLQYRTDIILHSHLPEYGSLLGQIAYSMAGTHVNREVCNLLVVQKYFAFIGCYKAYSHIECSRLAGTVRAKQSYNLTLLHVD